MTTMTSDITSIPTCYVTSLKLYQYLGASSLMFRKKYT